MRKRLPPRHGRAGSDKKAEQDADDHEANVSVAERLRGCGTLDAFDSVVPRVIGLAAAAQRTVVPFSASQSRGIDRVGQAGKVIPTVPVRIRGA